MMSSHGPPLLFALFAWWFSTGAILLLDRLPKISIVWSLALGSLIGGGALYGIAHTAGEASAASAYVAFSCALAIWGWHEWAFLTGTLTGPRTEPCPPGARGWLRFRLAAATLIYHELALAVTGAVVVALTWGQPNQTAAWTYFVLFVMRISAKLNIFLGVPNFTDDFLPPRLAYLKSYFQRRAFNPLFPVSIAIGLAIAIASAAAALNAEVGGAAQVGFTLTFALGALALVEHAFMVAPFRDSTLWRWAMSPAAVDRAYKDSGRMP
jgi:putative photosynthetic complex assembly protein 2